LGENFQSFGKISRFYTRDWLHTHFSWSLSFNPSFAMALSHQDYLLG
jgi:hypothetical protein